LAVIDVEPQRGLVLREVAPGITVADVQTQTEAPLRLADSIGTMDVS
jgi:acyl CoA:acetate/3-ketoacid CoA transferase beta subunit